MTVGYHNIMAAREEDNAALPPIKQDKKLNAALGKVFAAATEGPIPLDKTLANALTKIRDTKRWDSDTKAAMFNTIIDHVAIDERANVSLAVYKDNQNGVVERAMATRVFSDIELLDDAHKFNAAAAVVQFIPIPSAEVAERIINHVDGIPQREQFDALEEIYPHMHPYTEIVAEKMLDAVPNEYAPERHTLAMMVYDIAESEALQERALGDALKYVDDAPAKDRTKAALDISYEVRDPALVGDAVDVALQHATIPNKSTIKALQNAVKSAAALDEVFQKGLLSQEQIMGLKTALHTLREKPAKKPAPMNPGEFVLRMWQAPAP